MFAKASRKRLGRGRGVDATGRSIGSERYLRLPHYLLKSAAWQSLDPIARSLFVEVAQRYNGQNNGEIGLGVREAGTALHVRPQTAGRAFDTLVATGFLHIARDSAFNVKSKLSREWTVTLFPRGDNRATNEFMYWRPQDETKEQLQIRIRTVANQDTVGKERTYNDGGKSYCERQIPSDDSGLKRITSISHRKEDMDVDSRDGVGPVSVTGLAASSLRGRSQ